MAAFQGFNGKVKVNGSDVLELSSWELEIEADDLDTTSFESGGWAETLPGLKSWSGKIEGSWDMGTAESNQILLQNSILNGTPITLQLNTDATHYYSGTAYITKLKPETPVDDKVSVEIEFKGSGPVSFT